jgi:hypothetical protein
MMLTHHVDASQAYTAHRDRGNPNTGVAIMESMY